MSSVVRPPRVVVLTRDQLLRAIDLLLDLRLDVAREGYGFANVSSFMGDAAAVLSAMRVYLEATIIAEGRIARGTGFDIAATWTPTERDAAALEGEQVPEAPATEPAPLLEEVEEDDEPDSPDPPDPPLIPELERCAMCEGERDVSAEVGEGLDLVSCPLCKGSGRADDATIALRRQSSP